MSWLSDADGVPIDVAPSCIGFTVRHWPPKARGPGASLRDPTGSAALLVPTHTPPEQFRERVGDRPGKYLLTQVAASRRAIRGAAEAVVVLDPELTLDHAIGPSALDRVLSVIAAADQRTTATLAAFVARTAAELAQLGHQVETLSASLAELRAILIAPEFQTIAALMGGQRPAKPPPPRATAPRSTVAPVPSPLSPAARSAAPLPPRAAPPPAAPPTESTSTASTDELLRVFGVVAAPAAPAPPPTHAPAATTAPPYSDDDIRHVMADVINRLPPFPRAVFGEPAMATLFRQFVEASPGDLATLHDFLLSRQFVERLLGPFAPAMGISIDTLHTYWTTTDEAEIPAQLLEALRT